MPISKEHLLEGNRAQVNSESDDFTAERYQQMLHHLPRSAVTILDVGCNTGRGGAALKAFNPNLELFGLDCLQERVAQLDPAVYAKGICGFSTNIPVENNSFDAVLGGEFLEHVQPAEVESTLAEFFRILRLHGRLILTTPNPNFLKNKIRRLSVLLDKSHVTQHYPDCLRHRLRAVGFSRVKMVGSGRMTRYVGQHVPWLAIYGSYLIHGDKW